MIIPSLEISRKSGAKLLAKIKFELSNAEVSFVYNSHSQE
jgi:hypothetical protein